MGSFKFAVILLGAYALFLLAFLPAAYWLANGQSPLESTTASRWLYFLACALVLILIRQKPGEGE